MPRGERSAEALVEDFDFVGVAVAIGVFEDEDAVAVRAKILEVLQLAAVVDAFEHPDAAALVDIDVGGIFEQRLGGPELDFEAGSGFEVMNGLLGGLLGQEECRAKY